MIDHSPQLFSTLQGSFDGFSSSGGFYGWALDKADTAKRLRVTFALDGMAVAAVTADQHRDDLLSADKGDGRYGFELLRLPVTALAMLQANSQLQVFFDEALTQELANSPVSLTTALARQVYWQALTPDREGVGYGDLSWALAELRKVLTPEVEVDAVLARLGTVHATDSTEAYRRFLAFCRNALRQGEWVLIDRQLPAAWLQARLNQGLPVLELYMLQALARHALGELSEAAVAQLAELAQQPQPDSEFSQSFYQAGICEALIGAYREAHLQLLAEAPIPALTWRLLHVFATVLVKVYQDLSLAANVLGLLHRHSDLTEDAAFLTLSGETNQRLGRNFEALQDFAAAIRAGGASAQVYQAAAGLLLQVCEGRAAAFRRSHGQFLVLLQQAYALDPARAEDLRQLGGQFLRKLHHTLTQDTATQAQSGRVAKALQQRSADLACLSQGFLALPAPPSPNPRPEAIRRLLFVGDKNLPQCFHYRAAQKMAQAETLGMAICYFDLNGLDEVAWGEVLPTVEVLYLCRVPVVYAVAKLAAEAKLRAIPVIYDLDDLVCAAEHFPSPLAAYAGTIDEALHLHLRMDNPYFSHALTLADTITCSTPPLAAQIRALVGTQKTVVVHPNLLDPFLYAQAQQLQAAHVPGEPVEIFYGSATKAHKQVFYEVLAPALGEVLARYPQARFTAMGHFRYPETLAEFKNRVAILEPTADRQAYLQRLSQAQISVAVLECDPFTDCKSEIKWLEAAAFGIPSVVTPTASYRAALQDGECVLFAEDTSAWVAQLGRLLDSQALRRGLGENARQRALRQFSPQVGAAILAQTLAQVAQ